MASGGPRARSGPAPDPGALRRDRKDDAGWTVLPAAGRQGEAPEWPLSATAPEPIGDYERDLAEAKAWERSRTRELEIWDQEWQRPQAIMWERNGQELEVALYVRRLAEVEAPDAPVTLGTLVRQMQEGLGLSIPGLLRNRWVIADAKVGPQAAKPVHGEVVDARSRFGSTGARGTA